MPASPGPPVRDARFCRTKPSELEQRRKCVCEGTGESRMFKDKPPQKQTLVKTTLHVEFPGLKDTRWVDVMTRLLVSGVVCHWPSCSVAYGTVV